MAPKHTLSMSTRGDLIVSWPRPGQCIAPCQRNGGVLDRVRQREAVAQGAAPYAVRGGAHAMCLDHVARVTAQGHWGGGGTDVQWPS